MSQLIAEDGCWIPNITTQEYTVVLEAPCEHGKVRRAEVTIRSESAEDAAKFAETWLRQGSLRVLQVAGVAG